MKRTREDTNGDVGVKRVYLRFSPLSKDVLHAIFSFIPEQIQMEHVCKQWREALHHTNNRFWHNAYMDTFGLWMHDPTKVPKACWTKRQFFERLTRSCNYRDVRMNFRRTLRHYNTFAFDSSSSNSFCHSVKQFDFYLRHTLERDIIKNALVEVIQEGDESTYSGDISEIAASDLFHFPIFIERSSQIDIIHQNLICFTLSLLWYTTIPQECPVVIRARYEISNGFEQSWAVIAYEERGVKHDLMHCIWSGDEEALVTVFEEDIEDLKDLVLGKETREEEHSLIYIIMKLVHSVCSLEATDVVEVALNDHYGGNMSE